MESGMRMMGVRWTEEMRRFVQEHLEDDTAELLLGARRYGGIDVPFAVEQIEARRRLRGKLPAWCGHEEVVMSGRVPSEQCSSEVTARYKRGIIEGESLCDMTGGMGVDLWYMCEGMERAIYTERSEGLCEVARHNFGVLDDGHHPQVEVRCGDGRVLPIPEVDVIYLDPARRATDGSRVYAMEDCEPDVVAWQEELRGHAKMVLVKLSPMVDMTDVLRKLRGVTEVHVVAVRNECKEVLVKMMADAATTGDGGTEDVAVHCVDFLAHGRMEYVFRMSDEQGVCVATGGVGRYLYEPDVTLMKAQAFGSVCRRFEVCQLADGTHLMTSDVLRLDFPGRIFTIDGVIPFSSKSLKRLKRAIPKANIATRNFILSAEELRKRTGIKDGGEVYLFGARSCAAGDVLLQCSKVNG